MGFEGVPTTRTCKEVESLVVPLLPNKEIDDVDATLYDMQSHGTWLHCGYHLTTSIVAPPLLNLPYAVCLLGWNKGMLYLIIGALVTFYTYNLLSMVLEHYASKGLRFLRFQDIAEHILVL